MGAVSFCVCVILPLRQPTNLCAEPVSPESRHLCVVRVDLTSLDTGPGWPQQGDGIWGVLPAAGPWPGAPALAAPCRHGPFWNLASPLVHAPVALCFSSPWHPGSLGSPIPEGCDLTRIASCPSDWQRAGSPPAGAEKATDPVAPWARTITGRAHRK